MAKPIHIKRIYDKPDKQDGFRVLVDRMWPRGIAKDLAGVDLWLREIAPSTGLRKWFGHKPERWAEFKRRYFRELDAAGSATVEQLRSTRNKTLTLLYAAKDVEHNNAVALGEWLAEHSLSGPRHR